MAADLCIGAWLADGPVALTRCRSAPELGSQVPADLGLETPVVRISICNRRASRHLATRPWRRGSSLGRALAAPPSRISSSHDADGLYSERCRPTIICSVVAAPDGQTVKCPRRRGVDQRRKSRPSRSLLRQPAGSRLGPIARRQGMHSAHPSRPVPTAPPRT